MTYAVVTSFSQQGYQLYGERFLKTYRQYWPSDVPLIVYHEGTSLPSWCEARNLFAIKDCRDFITRHENNLAVQGRLEIKDKIPWKPKCRKDGYNFRYDAYKFSRKIFALADAFKNTSIQKIYWLDADVLTYRSVPVSLLEILLPRHYALCYLRRWLHYHSECGFVGYNLQHRSTLEFMHRFAQLYASDEFMSYKEWHDSFIFDQLRYKMHIKSYPLKAKHMNDVFNTSMIGQYMSHLKGPLKYKAHETHQ